MGPSHPTHCLYGHHSPQIYKFEARQSPDYEDIYIPRYEMESPHLIDLFEAWIMGISLESGFFCTNLLRSNHIPYVSSPELRKACMDFEICNNNQSEPLLLPT